MLKKWLGICHEQCTQCNGHATAFKMMFTYSVSIVCQEKSLHIQNNEKVLMFLMPSSQDRVQTETRNPTTSFTPPVFLIMLPLMLFFLIFDLFCTYWAVLGLFASLLAWMDPFILWPHSLTELFSEKALQLTAPFSFFPPLFLGESIIMRSKVLTVLQCTRIPKGKSFPMQGPWHLPTIESKLKSRFCVALLAIPVKLRFYFLKLKRRGGEKKSHQIFLRVEWRKKKISWLENIQDQALYMCNVPLQ